MALNYPSQVITSIGTSIRLGLLPLGVRVAPTYTVTAAAAGTDVTVTTSASAALGATSLTVTAISAGIPIGSKITFTNGVSTRLTAAALTSATTLAVSALSDAVPSGTSGTWDAGQLTAGTTAISVSALPVAIDVGEVLSFTGGNLVTVSEYIPAGATVINCEPTAALITAGNTATTRALLAVVGAIDASPSAQPKTTDITNFTSGVGMEMLVVGVGKTLNFTFNRIVGDRGGNVLMQLLYDPTYYNREVYVEVIRPFDGTYAGAAIITAGDQQSPVQEKVTQTATMNFQGLSFTYTPV